MATFKSPEVIINKSAEDFFNKIGDLNNIKDIMPSSVKDFESTDLYEIYNKLISVLENPKSKKYPQLFTEEEIISYYYRPGGPYFEKMFDKYGHLFAKGTRKKKALKKGTQKKAPQKKITRRKYKKR